MEKYIALLRGINLNGRNIKMIELKSLFETLGFSNIRTILSSGNILFDTKENEINSLTIKIEEALEKKFKHKVSIVLKRLTDIKKLIELNPFKEISVTSDTRLYITFTKIVLSNEILNKYKNIKDSKIINILEDTIVSVINITDKYNTTDLMNFLDKEFGKEVTTRNWNTILRFIK